MGDVVLELFLKEKGKLPKYSKNLDYFVAVMDDKFFKYGVAVAEKLRLNYNVEIELIGRNFGKQLKYANKIGASNLIVIGEDEYKNKKVKIKNMSSGREKSVSFDKLK